MASNFLTEVVLILKDVSKKRVLFCCCCFFVAVVVAVTVVLVVLAGIVARAEVDSLNKKVLALQKQVIKASAFETI